MDSESAIALELLQSLHDFCDRNALSNFKLVVRLSSNKGARWDDGYIRGELAKHANLKTVMVCGPPPMTETFDRLFSQLASENFKGLNRQQLLVF